LADTAVMVEVLTRQLQDTRSLREGARLRRLRDSYVALAENEAWIAGDIKPLRDADSQRLRQ
jgi:hypothetical protein